MELVDYLMVEMVLQAPSVDPEITKAVMEVVAPETPVVQEAPFIQIILMLARGGNGGSGIVIIAYPT